jgi:hypothetical protein
MNISNLMGRVRNGRTDLVHELGADVLRQNGADLLGTPDGGR